MLPHDEAVFFQIVYVIERRLGEELEEEPSNVRVEKALADVVRIFVVIDVLVMPAMLARPHQDGIFKRGRAEEQDKNSDWPFRAESQMGEQAVIAERDAESASGEEAQKQSDLKPIEAEIPEVSRYSGDGEKESADQERTRRPVDAVGWNAKKHTEVRMQFADGEAIGLGKKWLPSEDDVFFRPGMDFRAMRAGDLVRLHLLIGPKLFFNHLAGGREFRGGGTANENSFCHGNEPFVRPRAFNRADKRSGLYRYRKGTSPASPGRR